MALDATPLPGGAGGAAQLLPLAMGGPPPGPQGNDTAAATPEGAPGQSSGQGGPTPQQALLRRWSDLIQSPNIAQEIKDEWPNGEGTLSTIGMKVNEEYQVDEQSRGEWLSTSQAAMDLAMQVTKPKTSPWSGASNVIYPLVTVGAIQFAARAYPAIVANRNVVKGVVIGDDRGKPQIDPTSGSPVMGPDKQPQWEVAPGAKRLKADQIAGHMSYQILEEMPEWEEETDKLLHILPIVGCVFRKTYFDAGLARNVSVMVDAKNVVINYWAKSMQLAPRVTEIVKLYPVQIEENIRAGVFLNQSYGEPMTAGNDRDAPREFLEQHRRWDLDGDGYPEPYIVTVHKDTQKVARVAARFDPDGVSFAKASSNVARIVPVEYYTKYDFIPNPQGGIYGVGFGQVLRPLNESVNSALNQLFDAGSLQNTGGGFIGRGLSMHSGAVRFKLGEWKVVNSPGSTVRDAVVPFNHPGPSDTLFKLLVMLIEAGKDVSATKDVLAGENMGANISPTSLLAMIEQGLKVFTAIWKRVHRSLKQEYDKLYRLNRIYLDEETHYRVGDEWKSITRQDYMRGSGVVPYSDTTMVSDMQKLGRANVLQAFMNDPLFDGMEIRRRILEAADIEGADQMLHGDPMTNPMLFFKRAELGIEQTKVKAQALYHMARGVQALALGDKAIGDMHLDWVVAHMNMLQADLDNLNEMTVMQGQPGAPPPRPDPLTNPPAPPPGGDPPGVGQGKINTGMGFGGGQ